ncbi:NDR1/HIN1-like protein 13 [Glycine soja]|nr:NDR1/HIN1-like protein 13 [Glycine soja]
MTMEGHADHNSAVFPPPPGRHAPAAGTYIVQFPKDQVYRVPPRENALIVEQYRNPATAKKRRGGCCCCCNRRVLITFALVVTAIVAVVGITLATLYFIFSPAGPKFTVSHVAVNRNNKNSQGAAAQYEVSLRARNPNEKLAIQYQEGDVSLLLFDESKVAEGKFPTLEQGGGEASEVKLELTGSSGAFPRGMHGGDAAVDLKLEIKLAIRIRTAGLETWGMSSNVACQFKVSGLGNDTRILSQQCDTKFKQY